MLIYAQTCIYTCIERYLYLFILVFIFVGAGVYMCITNHGKNERTEKVGQK